jgi:hypothetical protein
MIKIALNEQLYALQCPKNEGRGVSCVRSIVSEISRGDTEGAKTITSIEWDKIRSYPDIAQWLKNNGFADPTWV